MIEYSAFTDLELSDQLYYMYLSINELADILGKSLDMLGWLFIILIVSISFCFLKNIFSKI